MKNEKVEMVHKIGALFFKYGIKSVSMDDIARELGISKKTLYQNFKDKRDVVGQTLSQHNDCGMKELIERSSNTSNSIEEFLQLLLMAKKWIEEINPSFEYDLQKYYPDVYKEHSDKRIINMTSFFTNNLNKGIQEGVYRNDIDVDIITKFHVTTMSSIHEGGLFTSAEISNHDTYKKYFVVFIRGLASEKGLEILTRKMNEYGF